MPPTRTTGRDTLRPPLATRAGMDIQRRRREVALTATWLRELRALTGPAQRAGRFTRYH